MKQFYMTSQKIRAIAAFSLVTIFNVTSRAQCVPPPAPVAPGTIVCTGTSGTLTATGGSNYNWFANSTGSLLASTPAYVTPTLTSNATYYVATYSTSFTGSLTMPSQTSTFSGNSRGYFFIAPTTMTITGVRVPTDASTGNFNVAILKFPAVPPLYSAVTNTFSTLYLGQNQTGTTVVSVNIPVAYGDVIGVLGDRAGICSYASPAPFNNMAFGSYSVTLTRLGMQFPLATTAPQDLWQEATGSISRVELYSNLACLSPLAAVNATVSTCTGIEELYGDDFRMSPNPSSAFVDIKVGNDLAGSAYFELYDALGKSVKKELVATNETRVNTSDLAPGVYIYKVYTSNRVIKTSKLIKN